MIFDMNVVEHSDGWFATGTVRAVSADGHLMTVDDGKGQLTLYAVSPMMRVMSWPLQAEWTPVGLCSDFTHGLLMTDDKVAVVEFTTTALKIVKTVATGNIRLAMADDTGLTVAGDEGWVTLTHAGVQTSGKGNYKSAKMSVLNNVAKVNNRAWRCVVGNSREVIGASGDDVLHVVIGKHAKRVVGGTPEAVMHGELWPHVLHTCGGDAVVVAEDGNLRMLVNDRPVTTVAPVETRTQVTVNCRVVTREHTGVGDLLTGKWTPASMLLGKTCIAVADGKGCVRAVTADAESVTLYEVSLGIDRARDVASWKVPSVKAAVVIDARKIVVLTGDTVYTCELGKEPVESGKATDLVSIIDHDPVLAEMFSDTENSVAWRLNGIDVPVHDLPCYGAWTELGPVVNTVLVTDTVTVPAYTTLPSKCKQFSAGRVVNVNDGLMISCDGILAPIEAKIDENDYSLVSVDKGYYNVPGLIVAAVMDDHKLCAVSEDDGQLIVTECEVKEDQTSTVKE